MGYGVAWSRFLWLGDRVPSGKTWNSDVNRVSHASDISRRSRRRRKYIFSRLGGMNESGPFIVPLLSLRERRNCCFSARKNRERDGGDSRWTDHRAKTRAACFRGRQTWSVCVPWNNACKFVLKKENTSEKNTRLFRSCEYTEKGEGPARDLRTEGSVLEGSNNFELTDVGDSVKSLWV